jgi:hypothetical protein
LTQDGGYAQAPVSVGEARAEKFDDCSQWTPRELLIAMLRDIDNGAQLDGIVVCFFEKDGGRIRTGMRRSKVTTMEAVAMCEMAKHDLLAP